MAKASFTRKGNVKVTMTTDQFVAIMAVLNHVRLGYSGTHTNAVSEFMIDMSDHIDVYDSLEFCIQDATDQIGASIDTDGSFSVEFKDN